LGDGFAQTSVHADQESASVGAPSDTGRTVPVRLEPHLPRIIELILWVLPLFDKVDISKLSRGGVMKKVFTFVSLCFLTVFFIPLAFSAEVEILPEIKLPDYKTIAKDIEKKEIKVEEKEINDTLNWLYRSRKDSQKFSEINDQWAQSFGGFKNLGELKASIYQGIMVEKEIAEKQRQREEVLEKIAQSMETEVPSILIEREKRQLIDNLKKQIARQLKISFQEYLSRVKKTEKDIEDDFQKIAQKRVKNFLILREIAKQEKISVSEEEKEVRMNEILKQEPGKSEEKKVDIEKLKLYIEDEIKQEKTFQLLNL